MKKILNILFRVFDFNYENCKFSQPNFTFNSIIAEKRNSRKMEEFKSLLELCNTMNEHNLISPEDEIATLQDYLDSGSFNIRLNSNKKELKKAMSEIAEGDNEMDDLGDIDLGSNELKSSRRPERIERPERSERNKRSEQNEESQSEQSES